MRQDIKNDLYRPLAYNALSAAISDNGELLTWQHKITGPAILERFIPFERLVLWSKGKTSLDGAEELPYSIANFKCTYATGWSLTQCLPQPDSLFGNFLLTYE